MQIFGSDPAVMAEAAVAIEAAGADIIDINMGCPVPKVVKNGEGAALLNNLPLAELIIRTVVNNVKIPVTVKCRLGWDGSCIVAPELARIAEDCGAAALAVHARTREQFYQGKADWDWITTIKQHVSIPVIGNGDIKTPQAARDIISNTGCDGLMIGQAALGRPWFFKQVAVFLEGGALFPEPTLMEKFSIMKQHLDYQVAYVGEEHGVKEMRKHFAWYLKGMPGAAKLKERIFQLTGYKAVCGVLQEYAIGFGITIGN